MPTSKYTLALLALVAALGSSTISHAATPDQTDRPPVRRERPQRLPSLLEGRVTAINSGTLTVQSARLRTRGPLTILTTPTTSYYVAGVNAPTLANIKTGDRVGVLLDVSTIDLQRNSASARAISVLPLPARRIARGDVSGRTTGGFTLTDRRGQADAQISVSSATRVIVAGKPGATFADIRDGDTVWISGAPDDAGMLRAALIVARPENRDQAVIGRIAAVNGSELVLFTQRGRQIVVDTAGATVTVSGDINGSVSALKPGARVLVLGTASGERMTAQLIAAPNLFGNRR
jgi:endonuclease YncB( thermonuclease family)